MVSSVLLITLVVIIRSIIVMSTRGPECSKIVWLELGVINNISHTLDSGLLKMVRDSLRSGIEEAFSFGTDGVRVAFGGCEKNDYYIRPFLPHLESLDGMFTRTRVSECNSTTCLNWVYRYGKRRRVEDVYLIVSTGYNNQSAMDHKNHADKTGINVFVLVLDVDDEWTLRSRSALPFVNGVWIVQRPYTSLLNVVHEIMEAICRTSTRFCQYRKYDVSCSPDPKGSGCVEESIYNITKEGFGCPTNAVNPCTCPDSRESSLTTQPFTMSRSGPMMYVVIGTTGGILLLTAIVITAILVRRRNKHPKIPVVRPPSRAAQKRSKEDRAVEADLKSKMDAVSPKVKKLSKKESKSEKTGNNSSSNSSDKKFASQGSAKKVANLTKQLKLPKSPVSSRAPRSR